MKNSFTVQEAHSGTSSKEIEKAKRLFREKVKSGEFTPYTDDIKIVFSDVNYEIWADFYDNLEEESHLIGSVCIN
jgi:hypothetical protein